MKSKQFLLSGIIVVVISSVAFTILYSVDSLAPNATRLTHKPTPLRNALLIGWDGARRGKVKALLEAGKLPNLARLVSEGRFVDIEIRSGDTDTKAGWTQILTGYGPEVTGVENNRTYRPIPKGLTTFERLEKHFGPAGIATIFLAGKKHNLGTRGPHQICTNCTRGTWFEGATATLMSGETKRKIFDKAGEPYHHTHKRVDVFENGLLLARNVGPRVLSEIERHQTQRFFLFVEFREPDKPPGHGLGEHSPEYSEAIVLDDTWLGRIVDKLEDLGIYDNTRIYIVADHGFDIGSNEHFSASHVFLATNDPWVQQAAGDRRDIAPTILERFGLDLSTLQPPLHGVSLGSGKL